MPPELWAGLECTVNRVGDRYFDQVIRSGHETRTDDLERFASLGIAAIRYPVLWERVAPDGIDSARWELPDRQLHRLSELGVRPIVGLVHHGSGPRHTGLSDPSFATGLAEYAGAVARRYPWIDAWTPVNEPLTTARFSGLYGHWYPHAREEPAFLRMLVTQCRAIVLAMRAVRAVNPRAQLVHTEDFGTTYSTPRLAYQAEFENHRRVLGMDLLFGRVNRKHPLWQHLREYGISAADIEWFERAECPPNIVGMNYYLTSDRMLDHRLGSYPEWTHGGNGRHRYADVAAVGAWPEGISGFGALLSRLWRRYRTPVALTEVHLGCTREEQLRWLAEAWNGCRQAQQQGVDVRALTVWSLLGAWGWNELVTTESSYYESGVFDIRAPEPRPTAIASMVRSLASGRSYEHPVLETPGWWRRRSRRMLRTLGNGGRGTATPMALTAFVAHRKQRRRLLILGATGTLGRAFARKCELRGLDYRALTRQEVDVTKPGTVEQAIKELEPWAVINASGYVRVDEAEHDADRCRRVNALGAMAVAEACDRGKARLVTFSSDLVFDGARSTPYLESHPVAPLNVYGISKAEAEWGVLERLPSALVIRTSAFFSPWDEHNFVSKTLVALESGEPLRASRDVVSPTYVPDLVDATLDLLIDDERGIWHVSNAGEVTWAEFARQTAELAALDVSLVNESSRPAPGQIALRPAYSVLGSERASLLPSLEDSLTRFFDELRKAA